MTDSIVIDASVVVDVLTGVHVADLPDGSWHAPAHLDVEVVHALRGLVLGGHLTRPRAVDALQDYTDLGVTIWPVDAVMRYRCFTLMDSLTAYDAAYVALAEGLDVPLITRDRRLAATASRLIDVVES
ncbi:MAG: type II toxin-antitoxin system VapC family toxin [Mobilicoccus sp.]|nr:type II toxin-antitoxin system VapC family toxin [Mobilicoccus sp.]